MNMENKTKAIIVVVMLYPKAISDPKVSNKRVDLQKNLFELGLIDEDHNNELEILNEVIDIYTLLSKH